ncbi:hypothetical protein BSL78_19785 [Apostichopus japonicus]|uniref:Uncharacterized protein n=1 Tax=Stichopus japonicus TaxID=307972 RepID=A0A2G8K5X6_STIJA|nr:hypothetical protein BSL78_19785 [Apostichopus japonicus]
MRILANVSLSHACSPNQGFYTIVRFPEVRSKGESLYVYAIFTDEISTEENINIDKDVNSFSSDLVEAGTVSSGENLFGCYIKINLPGSRSDQYKVGTYTATFMPNTGPIQHSIALVKSKSQILNTRGLFSLTVYPASGDRGETRLDHSTRAINLPWSPGCNKIRWIKDGRLVNTGRQLQLRKIKNAGGIYNIQQRSRGKRGIFVPFQVTVASK